ncbi:MAG TPA: helical backbone metal receptor [Puia sp.]|nr:helical backbone metal receptor [Puia sp.]
MPIYTDQTGRILNCPARPKKIVSLVPSQTEFLYDIGLEEEVVGITKFCIHPNHWFHQKKRVGGTKNISAKIIGQLQPDLIIANKEENSKEQIEELERQYPVWVSDVKTLQDALQMMGELGRITGREKETEDLAKQIKTSFANISAELSRIGIPLSGNPAGMGEPSEDFLKAAYLIWRNPYLTAGGDTFINDMMKHCRLSNIFESSPRYPEINMEQLKSLNNPGGRECELLLLSSEPFPFSDKHRLELQAVLPGMKIFLVDGEMFSWYGSRLLHAPAYFLKLLQEIRI